MDAEELSRPPTEAEITSLLNLLSVVPSSAAPYFHDVVRRMVFERDRLKAIGDFGEGQKPKHKGPGE